jgi:hypothetical protein
MRGWRDSWARWDSSGTVAENGGLGRPAQMSGWTAPWEVRVEGEKIVMNQAVE